MDLDELDRKTAEAFPGHLVRKDLLRQFRGQFPVPTYVVEFMLGRYCASTDPAEIADGMEMVQDQLTARSVRAGEEELFKSRARDKGAVKMIDIITATVNAPAKLPMNTRPQLRRTPPNVTPGRLSISASGASTKTPVSRSKPSR